jgi:hypothetical protein
VGLVVLGGGLFHACPFETRRAGEDRACPPRTVGSVNMVLAGPRTGLGWVGAAEAADLCLHTLPEPASDESAKEKITLCSLAGETRTFQADRPNRSAALCACGNATGAAAALFARYLDRREVRQTLTIPEGQVDVRSEVRRLAGGSRRVEQAWSGLRLEVREARLLGREVVVCTGAFNDYLIVRLPHRGAVEALGLDEVLALWREARQFSGFEDPLRSRLAALAPNGSLPYVRFFTCGRMHPGAPLTGLGTLAVAAGRVDWLADALRAGKVEHRRGTDPLPAVEASPQGAEIRFPAIDVVLHGI